MHEVINQLLSKMRSVWLRRWYAVAAAWLIAVIGWAVVYSIPLRYEASTRVYIDTQSILKPLMSGLAVNAPIEQQVNVMTRTLLSRPNMEKVARMTDMDLKAKTGKEMEHLVTGLMNDVRMSTAGQENLYLITYRNSNPKIAKNVVQSLLTILVEGSLGSKRKDTDSAKRFIDDQVKAYALKLTTSENALKEFKQKHLGLMPGEGIDYFGRLQKAQSALNDAQLSLKEAENRHDALKKELASSSNDDESTLGLDTSTNPELDARINKLKADLDRYRLTYTEQHPDIIAVKRIIAQLEAQKKQEAKLKKSPGSNASDNPYRQQLSISLAQADADIASLKARVAEFTNRFNQLKNAANMVPQVVAEYTQLMRNYDIDRKNYDALLTRSQSAQMSEDMESKTDVIDFKVIDPPYVPPTPSFPNRLQLYSLVLLLSVVGGVLIAFVVSQVRPTVVDRASIADVTEYPVLGSVSMVWNDTQTQARRKGLLAWASSIGALLSAYAVVMGITLIASRSAA